MAGGFVSVNGFELQNDNPYDNDNVVAAAYMSDSVRFNFVTFAGGYKRRAQLRQEPRRGQGLRSR